MGSKEENPRLTRVRYELRRVGAPTQSVNVLRSGVHTRGYLPHVKREGASYFVTFRLADSLPKEVLLEMEAERATSLRKLRAVTSGKGPSVSEVIAAVERQHRHRIEHYLDRGVGACWLRRPAIARIVADAMRFFVEERYLLDAWVVMPNHVHAVLWPMPGYLLGDILQSWKGYTAREANRTLGRTGQPFWQRESYDHWIRSDLEHSRCCRYVEDNPANAGLCGVGEEWPWSSAWRSNT